MKCPLLVTLSLIAAFVVGYFAGSKGEGIASPSKQAVSSTQSPATNVGWESFVENMRSEDQMTTALSLYSLRRLERGDIEPTKEFLASRIAYFYLSYGPADHPRKQLDDAGLEMLRAIHDFSQTNAILRAALERRGAEFSK